MQDNGIQAYTCETADVLVEEYAQLVKRIAHHLLARLPDSVQVDDLIQAGMIGLLEAGRKYDKTKGASFETYAGIRIRGSMLDEIRRGDWAPRSVHRNARRVSNAARGIETRLGRVARDAEIAGALEMDLDEYNGILRDVAGCKLFSLDELTDGDDSLDLQPGGGDQDPLDGFQKTVFKNRVVAAIKQLSEREQLVLSLYYDEELNLKEIGAVLEVSESRVSQIMSQATLRLRAKLSAWTAS